MNKTLCLLSLVLFVILLGLPSAQASPQESAQASPQESPQEQTAQEQAAQEPAMETAEPESGADYERGLRLYRSRSFREALTTFTGVAQMEPDRADVHYLMGYCHLILKEFQQSLDAFQRSFDSDPEFDPRTIYQQ